ncbi:ankyrin [Fusarium beomiforme]|uniref:Ankyrin n=1 Tax=Fusarium beomiforme TaxID=44412 RepID=A0A9P5AJS4_9HYPO|nr:ankyrin [Fusarium beomiforme]
MREEVGYKNITIIDSDGTTLYEKLFYSLRTAIIERNDTVALEKYLQKAPSAVKRGHALGAYYDPFIVAARHGSLDALKILLDHYSNFMRPTGRTDLDGRYPRVLNTAAQFGQLETVELLLDHQLLKVDIHADYNRFTPILSAADGSDVKDNFGKKKEALIKSLLHRGAHTPDAKYVWDYYLDPITRESKKRSIPSMTVLSLAAELAGADLFKRLIENGADPHVKLREDTEFRVRVDITIISMTSRFAHIDALKILLDCASNIVLLEQDPRKVSETVMKENVRRIITTIGLLWDCHPELINSQDVYGNTPLHYAANHYGNYGLKYTPIFKLLCDRGANPRLRNKKRKTALHELCCPAGGLPIDAAAIGILRDHGANITDIDDDGNTPLHLAVKSLENLDAIAFLLDHSADVGVKNLKQNIPLHEAANGIF